MNNTHSLYIKFSIFLLIATTLAFFSHVLIQGVTHPLLAAWAHGMRPSNSAYYPTEIIVAAYLTAFITISVEAVVYYYAGHLLKISNKILKSVVLALIILEMKGQLIRYTLVGYLDLSRLGAPHPIFYILINQANIWIPNLILAFCLVYLCPLKNKQLINVND